LLRFASKQKYVTTYFSFESELQYRKETKMVQAKRRNALQKNIMFHMEHTVSEKLAQYDSSALSGVEHLHHTLDARHGAQGRRPRRGLGQSHQRFGASPRLNGSRPSAKETTRRASRSSSCEAFGHRFFSDDSFAIILSRMKLQAHKFGGFLKRLELKMAIDLSML
jgi:hypothetical protein